METQITNKVYWDLEVSNPNGWGSYATKTHFTVNMEKTLCGKKIGYNPTITDKKIELCKRCLKIHTQEIERRNK